MFSGSSHQQYASYLLELHCLLEYESSPALRKTILNNYLVKFGLRFKERDLMQEDHNGKIQVMVPKASGDFDDPYHRNIITPNINHLIQIDRNFETGFSLKHRKTSHTSPGMRPEIQALLLSIKASELHLFTPRRSYQSHIAVDLFSEGYDRLGTGGKLDEFKRKTVARAKFIEAIEKQKKQVDTSDIQDITMGDDTLSMQHLDESSDLESDKGSDSETDWSSSEDSQKLSDTDIDVYGQGVNDEEGSEDSDDQVDEGVDEIIPSDEDEENWSD
jgi:hypothetical protein